MNKDIAFQKYKAAAALHAKAIDDIRKLEKDASIETVLKAKKFERGTWRGLSYACNLLIDACLEAIGR